MTPLPEHAAARRSASMQRDGMRWDRLLWGIEFRSESGDAEPMLIGRLWALDLGGEPYPGEPTRPLLFCTRQQARTWCAGTMRKWRDGRSTDDTVARWVVRPVRVRETVRVHTGNANLTGTRSASHRSNDEHDQA